MINTIEEFKKNGYTVVRNAIDPTLINFISQYCLFDELQDFTPDTGQVLGAHSKYADPAMETMLLYIQKIVENNTGLNLFPTYSFYRVYRNGDELFPHTDRESCEISVTMCFEYSYDDSKYVWPIFIESSPIIMHPGDIVIYRGIEKEHSREMLNCSEKCWHIQAFFHYVDADGPFANYAYDKREHIGIKRRDNEN